ncbi:MAG: 2-oxo acid dehydrogenase subunit E2, partial [Nitrospirae bacterium]
GPSIQATPPSSTQTTEAPSSQAAVSSDEEPRQKVSPRARTMAAERGIDLSMIKGSGPGGRIVEQDVIAAVADITPRAGTDIPLSQMRKAIARATTQSKAPVPHFYLTTEIAMDEAEKLRARFKESRREHPSMTAMLVKATALALTCHPEINVSYAGDRLRQHATIDIGVAVGLEDGLISPVLRDCGPRTLNNISTDLHELIERARTKRLQPQEYTGATFSISNLGMFDVENFIAVLMPPEAAALAVGAVRTVPVAEAGGIVPGRRMKVTLSCDHRALDGVRAAKFLREFKRVMEHPQALLEPEILR